MVRNIIFDFGGIILAKDDGIEKFLKKIFSKKFKQANKLFIKYKIALQTNNMSPKEFLVILKRKLKSDLNIDESIKIWWEEYKKVALINRPALNLVRKLNKNYNVYLFTNTIDIHDKYNSGRNIYNNFKRIFKSFEERLRKPDRKAYINVVNKIGARADECIFIDDLVENVKVAEKVGMKGIVYKDVNQLKAELRNLDIKV